MMQVGPLRKLLCGRDGNTHGSRNLVPTRAARNGEYVAATIETPSRPDRQVGAPVPARATGEFQTPGRFNALDKLATVVATAVPAAALTVGVWLAWDNSLYWQDIVIFLVCYIPSGLGITVGYHRLLTHRSFRAGPVVRALLTILGCTALEGPPIEWVANHRKHHAFSDEHGDPHSPHVGHGSGWRAPLRGLWHAHLGWVFGDGFANQRRYAPDLFDDPVIVFIDRTFLLWALVGLAIPFGLGFALTGTLTGALLGLLWGGAVRILVLHHVTFSINSLCHFFGRQDYATGDESRNLAWLAPLSLGEAWHNNHHAFPTSAAHGLRPHQVDPSWLLIGALSKLGLATNVVTISSDRREKKRCDGNGGPRAASCADRSDPAELLGLPADASTEAEAVA
jgi:stearoyl-CoA desaturase (delta-9 desaturase)